MDVNLEYYRIFYYVGKYKNITMAAEALALSQPAVSQAIKNLEKNLDSSLFIRTSKGVRLTHEGEVLYSYVKRGYETILLGEKKYREILDMEHGEICIGASDMTLQFYLLSHLEAFHEEYPGIKVTVTNAPTPETLKHLQGGKIDFGVVSTPIISKHNFSIHPVKKIRDIFVAGRKFAYLKNRVLSYRELENLPIVCLEENTSTRRFVEEFLKEQEVTIQPEFELATSDMLIQFAVRNLGVASVVEDFAFDKIQSGELFQLQFENDIPYRDFCVVYDAKVPCTRAAKELLSRLLQGK
ncbi:MAG: LysR family transcriptional regulator [Lachnospiraceae bacterium]|nr:LysR family transcriptional regulator [Lachnospiraceae bacterium]